MDVNEKSLELHEKNAGKFEVRSKVSVKNKEDLSLAYTPGVAAPCLEIAKDKENSYKYTGRGNQVAVVTDGSAVLGLGNIGAEASMPVMEGKAILFKEFADINAIPICLKTQNVDEIVNAVKLLEGNFGGINLEDISAPRCFEIEERLKRELNIPVFHDDQHGTAIVVLAGLINALKIVNKKIENVKIVICGCGAAGVAIAKLLAKFGGKSFLLCDRDGILNSELELDNHKKEMVHLAQSHNIKGGLADALVGADVFIGVSAGGIVNKDMIKSMNKDSIVFAMANPVPEIMPDLAKDAGARIVATGRSDFPNQINNVLAFPGIFRGALDSRAKEITDDMKIAAAKAIAKIAEDNLDEEHIVPDVFDERVVREVAKSVKELVG